MEWLEASKAYLEIGVLGICAILVACIAWFSFKRYHKDLDTKDKKIDKKDSDLEAKFNVMLEMIQKQNQEYQEQQSKNTELLIQSIINGITNHAPSPEENTKLTKITEEINHILQEMLIATGASRASLIQYHNGGKGVNRQSFLKMSMTNEQVQLGVKPIISTFKDQFRSVLAYFVKEINEKGYCYIDDFEDLRSIDAGTYEFLRDRGVEAKYGFAIHNTDNTIGFVCIEYNDKSKARPDLVDKVFKDKQKVMETLLSL